MPARVAQQGSSLIEVLMTLFILAVGLLGVAKMSVTSTRAVMEAHQRNIAIGLLQDMASRIKSNRAVAPCYAFTPIGAGTPFMGVGTTAVAACTLGSLEAQNVAIRDLNEWDDLLNGATAVNADGTEVGAMLGARGCVEQIAPNRYMLSVSWQGLDPTSEPIATLTCGAGLYGDERQRRTISITLQFGNLEA